MEYKGYTARVTFDQEAGVLFGEVEGLRDVVTFEATSVPEVNAAFREAVDDYLEMCAERGEEPEKPYSGKFLLRVDPQLHREISLAAAREGKSLNAFASDLLRRWLASDPRDEGAIEYSTARGDRVSENAGSFLWDVDQFLNMSQSPGPPPNARGNPAAIPAPSLTKHTPASITPSIQARTPAASRTPQAAPRKNRAA